MPESTHLAITLLIASMLILAFAAPTAATGSPSRRLGFWLQEGNIFEYTPQSFFNAMFLTPPYLSSMEVMVFAPLQDQTNNNGCSATTHMSKVQSTTGARSLRWRIRTQEIQLIFEIAFDSTNGGT